MKKIFLLVVATGFVFCAWAQQKPALPKTAAVAIKSDSTKKETPKIYNPAADAKADIAAAVKAAQAQHKNVLLQVGGNWCIWCHRFNELVTKDAELSKYMNDNFVVLHVNWSPENKNEKVMADLGYPQRFGFPVFVVLDGNGTRQHTQAPGFLGGEDDGYSKAKIMQFLQGWTSTMLDPKTYVEKEKTK